MRKATSGFTIVELLIVIVVVAILAAISIAAYNGIQSRAHDIAVKSDLRNVATLMKIYHANNGHYPHDPVAAVDYSDTSSTLRAELQTVNMRASSGSYSTATSNALFISSTDGTKWAFLAVPKNGVAQYVSNATSTPKPYTAAYPNCFPGCSATDVAVTFGIPHGQSAFDYGFTGSTFRFWYS
jgi:prepilin-type N-terminal cleavage/methylation domain-containing protein